ncbi:MAG: penicillin acylase family protein [Desulfobacteraceae bacterium]|jgi:penicillin amidase
MKIKNKKVTLAATTGKVDLHRMQGGFPRIEADEIIDLHYGLGYMHGYDRQMYMWLLKMIGQGRASEFIRAEEELIELDKFMRWIKLDEDATAEVQRLSPATSAIFNAYCKGVNDAVADSKTPLEFRMIGYRPDQWTPQDSILMTKLIGFMGLSQSQGDAEKFILQLIQNGVSPQQLKELFPRICEEISADLIKIINKVKIIRPIVSESINWLKALPGFSASNNWAVGPPKATSGKAILCGDPHLAIQLPSIWYSAVMTSKDHFMMGATLPGLPGLVLGRTPKLAWAVTYGAMDMIDYFIEEVRDQKYRRGEKWLPFAIREEVIRPKNKAPITIKVYENDCGILEGEPDEDGYYLNYAWSSRKGTAAISLNNLYKVSQANTAEEARDYFANLPFAPFNWLWADADGNIGYQLSGLFPKKAEGTSGLLPYLAWDESQAWQGTVSSEKYPRQYNPPDGMIVTANQDLNHLGDVAPMSLPMSSYRADRIRELLDQKKSLSVDDMKAMHYDRYSQQAAAFMEIIEPLLPPTENGKILKNWDRRYDASSIGATLFESVYLELLKLVFGENAMGVEVIENVVAETPMFAMLHGNFDRILLTAESAWFGDKTREKIYQMAIEKSLRHKAQPYGKTRSIYIPNIFFAGKLPKIFGFDYGPYEHIGSRATIAQAQVFKSMGYPSTFAATFRMITDFAREELHTNLAGGPSDRRFSKYYTMGLQKWINGEYEIFKP